MGILMKACALNDLKERGFIYQLTDEATTRQQLSAGSVTFYAGFDPTGNSLHVGHLLPVMAMRRLQKYGHRPIVLVGGATALVGDPSGKQEARPILTKEKVAENANCLKQQLAHFISMDDAIFVNNADWFKDLLYIDFLRDIGSRFSVNRMLGAESVKMRLETGLSFLEFNYMILQAYDFHVLNREFNCTMQIGGQDQWGNIVSGIDLIRRMSQKEVTGATLPLLMNSQGQKFGKTVAGAVWLDKNKTSVFDYYQFWRNCDDSDLRKLMLYFTSLPVDEIHRLTATTDSKALNRAKEILAYEATCLAHGKDEAANTFIAAGSKFGFADPELKIETTSSITAVKADQASLSADLPTYSVPEAAIANGLWIVKLLTDSGLCKSGGEARRLIQGGGAYINETRVENAELNLQLSDFKDKFIILKAGKKNIRKIVIN